MIGKIKIYTKRLRKNIEFRIKKTENVEACGGHEIIEGKGFIVVQKNGKVLFSLLKHLSEKVRKPGRTSQMQKDIAGHTSTA